MSHITNFLRILSRELNKITLLMSAEKSVGKVRPTVSSE